MSYFFIIKFTIFAGQRDIYGRRFLVLLPPSGRINKCEVHVTGTGEDLNVAAGSSDGIIPGTKTGNTIKYNCENIKGIKPVLSGHSKRRPRLISKTAYR